MDAQQKDHQPCKAGKKAGSACKQPDGIVQQRLYEQAPVQQGEQQQ